MLYRIHQKLLIDSAHSVFIGPGGVHSLGTIGMDKIKVLLGIKAITIVQAPPLETFAGWTLRAERLGAVGIDTIAFVEMSAEAIAEAIGTKCALVERWQKEIKAYLGINGVARRRR